MVDLARSLDAFSRLTELVESEQALAHLRPAARELERVARAILEGNRERYIPLRSLRIEKIPNAALAERVMLCINRLMQNGHLSDAA